MTGSGDLSITVTGDVCLDTVALDLTDLTLTASTRIVLSDASPIGVPGTPTETIDLRDVSGSTELSILGDAYFDDFDFTGLFVAGILGFATWNRRH